MRDLTDLRGAAARVVDPPLAPAPSLEDVARRASSIRRRRQWATTGVGTVAVTTLVLAAASLWPDADRATGRVRTVPAESAPEASDSPTSREGGAATPNSREGTREQRQRRSEPLRGQRANPAPLDREGSSETTWRPFDAGEEGCRAYSRPGRNPLGPGDAEPECSYTATKPGGYEGSGTWTIEVHRGARTIYFDSLNHPPCAEPGVIEAGDRVVAHLGLRQPDGSYTTTSAGEGEWHITVGTYARCPEP
jgi:hypothetical protein